MKCPTDGATLVMSERSGVEIDYCPTCRGVWLDRGELDKIIDRAGADPVGRATPPPPPDDGRYGSPFDDAPVPPPPPPAPSYGYGGHPGARPREDYGRDPRYRRRKRKDSWLEDLFDFD
ncbi:zf-TFIIB domain-containing protein [Ruania alkalisoli]|uniref:Zf-TFIIB domain-containing protein n=1 Tax=Ruania alkalisoli TaxID=2779775 RepID=A0A7M1SVS8_9MICO|nr:zf-TFIIB domain-containing protein [Ruania alkalisoli]QOR70733.1 zf-TFIIB domain-containing protein [Ruania alkalisoli]